MCLGTLANMPMGQIIGTSRIIKTQQNQVKVMKKIIVTGPFALLA